MKTSSARGGITSPTVPQKKKLSTQLSTQFEVEMLPTNAKGLINSHPKMLVNNPLNITDDGEEEVEEDE